MGDILPGDVKWSLHDVAVAALYANIPLNLPGFDRPKQEMLALGDVSETQSKFHQFLDKYRPNGWSHYDHDDLSKDFEKLFKEDVADSMNFGSSDDEVESRQQQKRIVSVRRKLKF